MARRLSGPVGVSSGGPETGANHLGGPAERKPSTSCRARAATRCILRAVYLSLIFRPFGPISRFISHDRVFGFHSGSIHRNRNMAELAVSRRVARNVGEHVGLAPVLQRLAKSLEQVV